MRWWLTTGFSLLALLVGCGHGPEGFVDPARGIYYTTRDQAHALRREIREHGRLVHFTELQQEFAGVFCCVLTRDRTLAGGRGQAPPGMITALPDQLVIRGRLHTVGPDFVVIALADKQVQIHRSNIDEFYVMEPGWHHGPPYDI